MVTRNSIIIAGITGLTYTDFIDYPRDFVRAVFITLTRVRGAGKRTKRGDRCTHRSKDIRIFCDFASIFERIVSTSGVTEEVITRNSDDFASGEPNPTNFTSLLRAKRT